MRLLDDLKWRYASKKYDTSKKVSNQEIEKIKEAVQLAASSYGLQPYKVLEIKDENLRGELRPISWEQGQITDASHLFLFCNKIEVTDEDVDEFIKLKAEAVGVPVNQLAGYGDFIKGKLKEKSKEEMFHWTAKQAYIALGTAIDACAHLKIDSTPMEGFDLEAYNKKLGLTEQGYSAAVLLAVGYRHSEDIAQKAKKVRKSIDSLFETI